MIKCRQVRGLLLLLLLQFQVQVFPENKICETEFESVKEISDDIDRTRFELDKAFFDKIHQWKNLDDRWNECYWWLDYLYLNNKMPKDELYPLYYVYKKEIKSDRHWKRAYSELELQGICWEILRKELKADAKRTGKSYLRTLREFKKSRNALYIQKG